jgi:hypothetical protein
MQDTLARTDPAGYIGWVCNGCRKEFEASDTMYHGDVLDLCGGCAADPAAAEARHRVFCRSCFGDHRMGDVACAAKPLGGPPAPRPAELLAKHKCCARILGYVRHKFIALGLDYSEDTPALAQQIEVAAAVLRWAEPRRGGPNRAARPSVLNEGPHQRPELVAHCGPALRSLECHTTVTATEGCRTTPFRIFC